VLIRKSVDIKPSEITDQKLFLRRREFFVTALGGLAAAATASALPLVLAPAAAGASVKFQDVVRTSFSTDEPTTGLDKITAYNNFYEFGTDKEDPARNAVHFRTRPWSLAVEGEVARPGVYDLEEFIKPHRLEERIYRLRCVEAWSMVIPWVGIPLAQIIKRFEPRSNAKFVEFVTLFDPEQMPGQRRAILDWPYVEGLRIDEAMHPLTLLAVGLYGEILPNQNGAPMRLVVPWKYGFKSIKSIVKIRFVEHPPRTAWNKVAPDEYGFYANVNPKVDHPRWSQRKERRIGEFFRRDTLLFNGYAEQVAHLYAGMDLTKQF